MKIEFGSQELMNFVGEILKEDIRTISVDTLVSSMARESPLLQPATKIIRKGLYSDVMYARYGISPSFYSSN